MTDWMEGCAGALTGPGWFEDPAWLAPEAWRLVYAELEAARANGEFRAAGIGHGLAFNIRPEIRGDQVRWIDPGAAGPATRAVIDALDQLRGELNRRLFLGLADLELQYAVYPVGARYSRHVDRFRDSNDRVVSVVLYLNEVWTRADGGQLRLHVPASEGGEAAVDLLPSGGRLVCFLSDAVAHEVLPTRKERCSVVGWFRRAPRYAPR
ncbi:MAG: 2OG-Fe(II) oxygenase [Gammaproteobacteria bacterium]